MFEGCEWTLMLQSQHRPCPRGTAKGWPRLGRHPPVCSDTVTLKPAQQCLHLPHSLSTATGGGSLGCEENTVYYVGYCFPTCLPLSMRSSGLCGYPIGPSPWYWAGWNWFWDCSMRFQARRGAAPAVLHKERTLQWELGSCRESHSTDPLLGLSLS